MCTDDIIDSAQPAAAPFLCRMGYHKWSVWDQGTVVNYNLTRYTQAGAIIGTFPKEMLRQQRHCVRCNEIESREVDPPQGNHPKVMSTDNLAGKESGEAMSNSLNQRETFTVYGLILGMLQHEQSAVNRGEQSSHPARDWYNQWWKHPDMVKAAKLYRKEDKRLSIMAFPRSKSAKKRTT